MNKRTTEETRAPRGLKHHQIVAFHPCLGAEVPRMDILQYLSKTRRICGGSGKKKSQPASQPERPGTALLKSCSQDKHIGLVKILLSHSWLSGHSFISEAVSCVGEGWAMLP